MKKKGVLEQVLREAAANPEEVIVLFTDEVSFYCQPSQAWLWAGMGRRQPRLRYSHRANTLMRVVAARPGLDSILAVMNACRPELVQR